ncbi:MAG TPA: AAA family ATPase, partial [Gemmataceae bacterium]|nr:AAA family ATPase [Gemmataceae bacterium]
MTDPLSTPVVPPGDLPDELWADDLRRVGQTPLAWLWHGYLKPGAVTLLTSRWKSGKTTLLSVLLSRL